MKNTDLLLTIYNTRCFLLASRGNIFFLFFAFLLGAPSLSLYLSLSTFLSILLLLFYGPRCRYIFRCVSCCALHSQNEVKSWECRLSEPDDGNVDDDTLKIRLSPYE